MSWRDDMIYFSDQPSTDCLDTTSPEQRRQRTLLYQQRAIQTWHLPEYQTVPRNEKEKIEEEMEEWADDESR